MKGDWNEESESLDTIIEIDGETTELNYHPLDSMGGLDLSQLENNINEAFRELNTYSAVVSIEGYEEYAEDVEGLENARATIQDIKGNTRFQVLKGSSVGIGKRVDDSRVVEEFRKGGNVSSIEKKVQEVNRLIELGNKNGISVVDSRSTWEAPMKYKPIRYSNGVLYVEYQQLDLYKYNKKGISNWVTKKDKVLKRDMQFDNPLNDIAKMYRKALKQEDVEYAKGGEAGKLKDYVVYSWKTKKDVINDDYEIINEEEMTEKDVIELYKERIKRGYDLAIRIIEKSSRNEVYTSKSYDDIIDAHYSDSEDEGNDYYDLKEKILSKYGLHLEGNRVRTDFKSTAYQIANEFDGYVEQDSDYYIVSFRNLYAKGGEAGFDDAGTSMGMYHEKKGNFIVPKGQIYLWLYDNEDGASKMNSGEYDFVMYPYASMSMAWQKGFIPPLKRIWTKKFQKDHKGSEHLLGVVKAYLIEEKGKKELFIDMMSVNPNSKKKGIMSYMIKDLRDTFNLSKDQVKFSQLTKEGDKFVNKGKYADGGNTEILTKPRPVTEPAPTQTPAPSKPDRNNPYKPKVTPKPKMSKYDYIWLVK